MVDCTWKENAFEAWRKHAHTGTRPDEWIAENKALCELVFPGNELDRVLNRASGEGLLEMDADVQILHSSCSLGQLLFSAALQNIAKQRLQNTIKQTEQEVFAMTTLTAKVISDALSKCSRKLSAMAGAELLEKLQSVPMKYRGIEYSVDCGSALEVAEQRLQARLRGVMASRGLIPLLPGEDAYASIACTDAATEVSEDLSKKAHRARTHLKQLLTSRPADEQTGDTLKVRGKFCRKRETHASTLLGIDCYFCIDLHILRAMMSERGGDLLKQMWQTRCVDDWLETENLTEAWAASNRFVQSDGYKWGSVASKHEIEGAHQMLGRLVSAEQVMRTGESVTVFMSKVAVALQGFITCERDKTSSKSSSDEVECSSGPLRGVPALQMLYTRLLKQETKTITAEQLKPFAIWRHLLTNEQETKIAEVRNNVLKRPVAAVKVAPPTEAKKAKQSKPKAGSEAQITATARALLNLK
eukprot:5655141-Amphidinium_carterae.4